MEYWTDEEPTVRGGWSEEETTPVKESNNFTCYCAFSTGWVNSHTAAVRLKLYYKRTPYAPQPGPWGFFFREAGGTDSEPVTVTPRDEYSVETVYFADDAAGRGAVYTMSVRVNPDGVAVEPFTAEIAGIPGATVHVMTADGIKTGTIHVMTADGLKNGIVHTGVSE